MSIMIPAWVNDTLVPVEKLEVHQRGLRHKAVSVFVLRGSEILLQRRALGKYHTPGLWANACCTHPMWEEDAGVCAVRRLNEELGIKAPSVEFCRTLEYRADVGNGLIEHEVVDLFMLNATPDIKITPNPEEVMEVEWIGFDALQKQLIAEPDRFTPWLRIYMADFSDSIFGPEFAAN